MTEEYLWTPRWYLLDYHEVQYEMLYTTARFITCPAGRRSGKTELGKRKIIGEAIEGTDFSPSRFFCGAPTRPQGKAIFWNDLKQMVPKACKIGKPSESELCIKLRNLRGGTSEIWVHGLNEPERIEGAPWDGCVVDEIDNCKNRTWPMHIRPALSTRGRPGWGWLIGVPEGEGEYQEIHERALADTSGEWAGYWWPSEDILPPEEIEAAKRDLDPLVYEQEFRGSFVSFSGKCYYGYRAEQHEAPLEHDAHQDLIIALDFNVSPGVAAIGQEMALPNGEFGTGWIGEVWIPRNSNTPAVCRKIAQDWCHHQGRVKCYGDATGGARKTSSEFGNDWQLVERDLRPVFGDQLTFHVKTYNPSERSRINAVNSRLMNASQVAHMVVDRQKCPNLSRDFRRVRLLEGGSGEIDKKSNLELSHISDAAGYYVAEEFPVSRKITGHIHSADIAAAIGKPVESHAP